MITERIYFSKTGDIRYISHLDLYRTVQRAIARSGIEVWYTEGYNKHMYLSFPLALSLGCEGLREIAEIKLFEPQDGIGEKLNALLPDGIEVFDVREAVLDINDIAYARYTVELADAELAPEAIRDAWNRMMSAEAITVSKKNKKGIWREIDIKPDVLRSETEITEEGVNIDLTVSAGTARSLNPGLLFDHLFTDILGRETDHYLIRRTDILTKDLQPFE